MGFWDMFDSPDYSGYERMAREVRSGYGDFQRRQMGVSLGISGADQEMAKKSIGYTGDLARMQLEAILPQILAQVTGGAQARGMGASSGAALQRSDAATQQARMVQEMLIREQMQQAQALPQMAFQRAGMELGRNAQLFQSLLGSYQPSFDLEGMKIQNQAARQAGALGAIGGAFGMAGKIGTAIATGGASAALPGIGFGGGGGGGGQYPDPWAGKPMTYDPYGRR